MADGHGNVILRSPTSPSDWETYFDLRWRLLRQPWGQPRGSERDPLENSAFHLLLLDVTGNAVGCGRLHFNAPEEAQVRYMAVAEEVRGRNYGSRILEGLEAEARNRGAHKIVLNSRENARDFYLR